MKLRLVGVTTVCLFISHGASAACAPGDIIGRWYVTIMTPPFIWTSSDGTGVPRHVTIDARGTLDGVIKPFDPASPYPWSMKSVTPIKVDASCSVTGQFALVYPPTERKTFALRAVMSVDKNEIGESAFVWPGYDTAGSGAAILINMKRR